MIERVETQLRTLRECPDVADTARRLREIKHQLIGNDGEKVQWVQAGLLPVLVTLWQDLVHRALGAQFWRTATRSEAEGGEQVHARDALSQILLVIRSLALGR